MSNFNAIGERLTEKAKIDGLKDAYLKKHAQRTAGFHTLDMFQMAAAEVVRRGYNLDGCLKEARIQKKGLHEEFLDAGFDVSANDIYKLHRVGWFGAKYQNLEDDFLEFEATEPVKGITTTGFLNWLIKQYEPKEADYIIKINDELEVKGSDDAQLRLELLIEKRVKEAIAARDAQWVAREKATSEALFGDLN
jgi:hypothetical protein